MVLALGGGFQAYFQQKRDGSVFDERMPVMADVARFCRARQAVCHHAKQVPQVALLYSTAAYYRHSKALFSPSSGEQNALKGVLQALLETQNSVEILSEHHLTGHMKDYPLIVVPECDYLYPKFKSELVDYVKRGGDLLLIGPKAAALFQPELGVTLEGEPGTDGEQVLEWEGAVTAQKTTFQSAKLKCRDQFRWPASRNEQCGAAGAARGFRQQAGQGENCRGLFQSRARVSQHAQRVIAALLERPGAGAFPEAIGRGDRLVGSGCRGQPDERPASHQPGQHRRAASRQAASDHQRDPTRWPANSNCAEPGISRSV